MKKLKRVIVIFMIGLFLGGIFFLINGEESQAGEGKVVFSGDNFSCQSCQKKVETVLNNIIGIEKFEINPQQNEVTIYYDESTMKPEWIEKSLEASGFTNADFK